MERVAEGELGVGNRKFCTRGLEKLSKAYQLSGQRENVYKLVLQLQKFQREQEKVDPEAIASLYGSACDRAVQEAVSLAKLDEEAIKSYMKAIRPCAS
jgi:Glu-tRNA(Gln) amidotransferase subunit E-like FAD-binding protein